MTSRIVPPLLGLCLLLGGCSHESADTTPAGATLTSTERSLRILSLEREVVDARRRLEDLISEPEGTGESEGPGGSEGQDTVPVRDRPELREIAAQLATLSAELDELHRQAPGTSRPATRQ
jgi:hypothetical protein